MNRRILFFLPIVILLSSFLTNHENNDKGNQRAWYDCTQPFNIDAKLFEVKNGQTYFYFDKNLAPKNLKSQGFFGYEDNPKDYFTAYLINTSDSTFKAERQDGSLMMIQEAMNDSGVWQPIEYWVYSGCGNSYFDPLELDSGKYVTIPIKKYEGSFKTQFRLKMKTNSSIFYSETFEGSLEKSQFEKQTEKVNGILYLGPASYLE